MSGHRSGKRLGYQCRLRQTYALALDDPHPRSVWLTERSIVDTALRWLAEVLDSAHRDAVLAQIAGASDVPKPGVLSAEEALRSAETQIARLVESVAAGVLSREEVAAKLGVLRAQRDAARALLAARPVDAGQLDEHAVGALLDELGGLLGIGGRLTPDEMAELLTATNLTISHDHSTRLARFRGRAEAWG